MSQFSRSKSLAPIRRSLPTPKLLDKLIIIERDNPYHKLFLIRTATDTIRALCETNSRLFIEGHDIKQVCLRFKQISKGHDGHLFKGAEFDVSNLDPFNYEYVNGDKTKFYLIKDGKIMNEVIDINDTDSYRGGRKKSNRKSTRVRRTRKN